jgi:hypothetical protein
MRQAHLRDAAALANFWAWLEKLIVQEKKAISEVRVLGWPEKLIVQEKRAISEVRVLLGNHRGLEVGSKLASKSSKQDFFGHSKGRQLSSS